jgi:hypothetical protein
MDGALYGSLEITLLYQFFGRGTRIRDGVQERHFILLISRLYLGKREKPFATEDIQAKKRVLIPAYQRFKSFLITSKCLLKQDIVCSLWLLRIPIFLCFH